jgi:hypothetical protein
MHSVGAGEPRRIYPQMTQMDADRENSRGINRRRPQRKTGRNSISILLCGLCG